MSTELQKNLANNIVKNLKRKKPLNKKELVVSSGYGEISAESSAHIILDQKGVKDALHELGFNEDTAKNVVKQIMLDPETAASDRLKATDQVFKVQGSYAPEKSVSVNINANIEGTNPELDELRKNFNEKAKQALIDQIKNV